MKKALIAMSGGVDSSMSALLMQKQGYECFGVTMRLHDARDYVGCGSSREAMMAAKIAEYLGIPFRILDYTQDFEREVMRHFVAEYARGFTPNPCIYCNRTMKFGNLVREMQALGCEKIVTGHYARVDKDPETGLYRLKKGADPGKDQSYVLYMLTQDLLAHIEFPLGNYKKEEVRAMAAAAGLENASKKDSQDICFVPDGDYSGFIERYAGFSSPVGNFIAREDGHVIGPHKGISAYTIGQRKGLGISAEHPLYVCAIDPKENTVTLGREEDLYADTLTADQVNLILPDRLKKPEHIAAKVRYRQKEQPATAYLDENGLLQVRFDMPQRAITCGQAVVLYDGEVVLGGGTILRVGENVPKGPSLHTGKNMV